jgi:hypothetical protein
MQSAQIKPRAGVAFDQIFSNFCVIFLRENHAHQMRDPIRVADFDEALPYTPNSIAAHNNDLLSASPIPFPSLAIVIQ